MKRFITSVVVFGAASFTAHAKPVVEKNDRVEIDWSAMKIRFYGEAQAPNAQETYRGAEQRAWQDGIAYISMNLNKLRDGRVEALDGSRSEADRQALKSVTTSTYSVNTTYFSNGKIRVHLENALPRALDPGPVAFKSLAAEKGRTKNSGLVLRVAGTPRPSATYRVVTDQGQAVFEVRDVSKESFEKNFMGAWFQSPSPAELQAAVGSNPIYVDAQVDGAGTFRVSQGQWTEALSGNESLLRAAKVAVAIK